jgi:fumarate reductase subunit C
MAVRRARVRADRPARYPPYMPPVPRTWWLRTGPFRRFAAREATSGFAAAFSVMLLLFLLALSRGRDAYDGFLRWLDLPVVVAFSTLILAALLYHVATWIRLSAHILTRLGRIVIPRRAVVGILVGAWAVASALVVYFHIWFSR